MQARGPGETSGSCIMMTGTGHCMLAQAHRTCATRRDPRGALWAWVMLACRCRSSTVTNACSGGGAGEGGASHVRGQRGCADPRAFGFCCEPETALKH